MHDIMVNFEVIQLIQNIYTNILLSVCDSFKSIHYILKYGNINLIYIYYLNTC